MSLSVPRRSASSSWVASSVQNFLLCFDSFLLVDQRRSISAWCRYSSCSAYCLCRSSFRTWCWYTFLLFPWGGLSSRNDGTTGSHYYYSNLICKLNMPVVTDSQRNHKWIIFLASLRYLMCFDKLQLHY